jgi:hypothetical protein
MTAVHEARFYAPLADKKVLCTLCPHDCRIPNCLASAGIGTEHDRIRLGLDYRLIVHWQPGKVLRILDVIPRQDLESWIRRQG